jgi:hypothetical protein
MMKSLISLHNAVEGGYPSEKTHRNHDFRHFFIGIHYDELPSVGQG